MNWTKAETDIYNDALKLVEKNNKLMARMYLKTQKEIAEKLKKFYLLTSPTDSQQYQAARLAEIFKDINKRLTLLTGLGQKQIEDAFLDQYKAVFNSYSYALGEYAGLLPLSMVSESVIKAGLSKPIGKYNFKDYGRYAKKKLQEDLREQIAISLNKGEGPAKLSKRLEDIFGSAISRHTATARTELLKSYSLAQEEGVNQAEELGIEFKFKWLGRNDFKIVNGKKIHRERPAHRALNDTYAKKGKDGKYYFYGLGCKGTSPRLFTGPNSAAMNVNCRCRRLNIPVV